jgi:hypothetical protein
MLPRLSALLLMMFVLAVGGVGCVVGQEHEDIDATEEAILGGRVERGQPAVGVVVLASGNIGSGVLISPTMVLTAGHVAAGRPHTVYLGSPAADALPRRENLVPFAIAEIISHPCYERRPLDGCPGPAKDPIDVALLRLETPVEGIKPLPLVDTPLEMLFGLISPFRKETCLAVGFGIYLDAEDRRSHGTRRSALSTIDSIGPAELVVVRATGIATGGDSGGPLICRGQIVGVVRGSAVRIDPERPYDRTREAYERIDIHRAWIRRHLLAAR